ncbi:hypothetical protein PFMALIP_05388 [Plasmodium falciparum MaliPS096_E11]|uniref:Methyltransferase type 11 domain-containing protein n=1 Tax=Plasmodium falciparum MaliPS096_E11 TaxID=1036727 RepID=A0A024WGZ1_PLAFA|nr:hypothetical protein PFMALIP_05388 [Plasmodium falciparum MaliPS096_E11]
MCSMVKYLTGTSDIQKEQFDWHQRWYGVKHIFTELEIKNDANILNIGCGTSSKST